jgi:hypothetical protein
MQPPAKRSGMDVNIQLSATGELYRRQFVYLEIQLIRKNPAQNMSSCSGQIFVKSFFK